MATSFKVEARGGVPTNAAAKDDSATTKIGKKRCLDEMVDKGDLAIKQDKRGIAMKQVVYSNNKRQGILRGASGGVGESIANKMHLLLPLAAANTEVGQPTRVPGKASAKSIIGGESEDDAFEKLTFPERLMYLLQNEVAPDALWWQKDSLSFGFEHKRFTESILNKLFPTKIKFESFIRKLNRWGFRRVPGQSLPSGGAAYKHPLFQKSSPEMMKEMRFGQKVELPSKLKDPFQQHASSAATSSTTHLIAAKLPAALARQPSGDEAPTSNQATLNAHNLTLLQSTISAHSSANHISFLSQQSLERGLTGVPTYIEHEAYLRSRQFLGNSMPLATSMHDSLQRGLLERRQSLSEGLLGAVASVATERGLTNSFLLGSQGGTQRRHSQQSMDSQTGRSASNENLEAARNLLCVAAFSGGAFPQQQGDVPVQHINYATATPPLSGPNSEEVSHYIAILRHHHHYQQQHQQQLQIASGGQSAEVLLLLERLRRQTD